MRNGFGNLSSSSGGAPGGRAEGRGAAAGRGPGDGFTAEDAGEDDEIAVLVALDREVGCAGETSYDCPHPPQVTGPATESGEAC